MNLKGFMMSKKDGQTTKSQPTLRQLMSRDLQLLGRAKRTHDGYLREWMASPENFLLSEKAAAKIYPGKFRHAMRDAGLESQFKAADAKAWFREWTVDVQAVGDGRAASEVPGALRQSSGHQQ